MATLGEILAVKGGYVHTVPASSTVMDAVYLMNEKKVGALVVTRADRVNGMFTERDVLRRVVGHPRPPSEIAVAEVMTADVLVCAPETSVDEAGRIMKDRRIRHLPICDSEGNLLGLISIGDLNAYHANHQEATIHHLKEYVYGTL
jgi:CBS domain-containing protein